MKERVGGMVGQVVEGMPWLGTFHSIGVKILRRHAELVGLKSDFTILDTDDQIRLLKQLLEAEGIDEKRWPARVLAGLIDRWKNRGLTPEQVPAGRRRGFANGKGKKLYAAFQERLKMLNAADFGDLLLECIRLFRENPEVLRAVSAALQVHPGRRVSGHQRRAVSVAAAAGAAADAAHRHSPSRRHCAESVARASEPGIEGRTHPSKRPCDSGLAPDGAQPGMTVRDVEPLAPPKNICCVGDDDQSIYGWRGAEVDNILRFDHDFPGAKVIRLERNYRSHRTHPRRRLAPDRAQRRPARQDAAHRGRARREGHRHRRAGTARKKPARSARRSRSCSASGHMLDEIAILVRASFQMREFEDRFVTLGLPYRVIGGPRFYERAEIRDALAYLRVIHSPADDLAFERIVNVPKRGLGDATIQILHDHARKRRVPLTEAARAIAATDELKPKPRNALRTVIDNFDRWRAQKDTLPHNELAEIVLDESGYTEMWQKDRSADAAGRLENLKELVRSMEEFENLAGFLEHISLVMDTDQRRGRGRGQHHDAALRQGAGVRHRVPARLGGRPVPAASARSTSRAAPGSRRSAASPMSASRARASAPRSTSPPTAASTACGTTNIPSRFLDELPEANVEVTESKGGFGGVGAAATARRASTR